MATQAKELVPVWIGLGSNLGDSVAILQQAVTHLGALMDVERVSTLVRTAPMYVVDQPDFVNGAVVGRTWLGPFALLKALKNLERELGRQPRTRNGPRELDLDLLGYGVLQLKTNTLELPHPRLRERRFVLQPLAEIAPGLQLPGFPPLDKLLQATDDQAPSVQPISDAALSISRTR